MCVQKTLPGFSENRSGGKIKTEVEWEKTKFGYVYVKSSHDFLQIHYI